MMIKSLTLAAASLIALTNAQYDDPYTGGGGYETPECCSCVPTSSPVTPFPTAPPTQKIQSDEVCHTDGGYVATDSMCLDSWTYVEKGVAKKMTGCAPVDGKYKPYVDPENPPTPGKDMTMWCSTVPRYDPKKPLAMMEWGYCICDEYGCLPDSVEKLAKQAKKVYQALTKAQQQRFKQYVGPASEGWYEPLPLSYSGAEQPPCYTDGGLAAYGTPCMEKWMYVDSKGVETEIIGCATFSQYKPYNEGKIAAPQIVSTSKTLYCSTVEVYDPKKSSLTKKDWGYCSCLDNLATAAVNEAILAYNPLTKAQRTAFWKSVA